MRISFSTVLPSVPACWTSSSINSFITSFSSSAKLGALLLSALSSACGGAWLSATSFMIKPGVPVAATGPPILAETLIRWMLLSWPSPSSSSWLSSALAVTISGSFCGNSSSPYVLWRDSTSCTGWNEFWFSLVDHWLSCGCRLNRVRSRMRNLGVEVESACCCVCCCCGSRSRC
uniref:(northern house mosquito) hypothetical protein n=1 Tax=Culex pipiens TaxID=7175 RepID=A0A8D8I0W5_CULPI